MPVKNDAVGPCAPSDSKPKARGEASHVVELESNESSAQPCLVWRQPKRLVENCS